jgi:hypothetical protein
MRLHIMSTVSWLLLLEFKTTTALALVQVLLLTSKNFTLKYLTCWYLDLIIISISCDRSWALFNRAMTIVLDHWFSLGLWRHYDVRISTLIIGSNSCTSYSSWILLFHISCHEFINRSLIINLLGLLSVIFCLGNRTGRLLRAQLFIAWISMHLIGIGIL